MPWRNGEPWRLNGRSHLYGGENGRSAIWRGMRDLLALAREIGKIGQSGRSSALTRVDELRQRVAQ